MGPRETTRNNSGPWYEWYLDPLRFEEFKAELDADGEYSQTGSFPNNDRGTPEALWVVIPDGGFQLELRKEDGSGVVYEYKKVLGTSGHKVDELLRRYMGSSEQTWDEGLVHIYYLDPLRFEEFKTEIETGGEYYEDNRWTNANRDWDRGMTSAWWVDVTGGGFILELLKKDNSTVGYGYGKISE
jgi:hypothetical protein